MSSDNKERSRRFARRSIPQLIPRQTDKKTETTTTNQDKQSPKDGASTKPNKNNKLEKKLSNYRQNVDGHPKTKAPLSLQGPFNPDIVGHRKTSDDTKRKRHPTPTRFGETKTSSTSNGTATTVGSSSASVPLFSTLKLDADDPKAKRNHGQESKQRCAVDFSQKAETKFAENLEKSIVFTAAGQGSSGLVTKRPPRDRVRRSSGNSSSASTTFPRVPEQRRSDKVLRENIQQLEEEKQHLIKKHTKELSGLKAEINKTQDAVEKLKKDNSDLEKALEEHELKKSASEENDSKCLEIRNEALGNRLDICQKKLEEMNIDPVSHGSVEGLSAELVLENQRQAAEDAEKLRQILKSSSKRNEEIVEKLKIVSQETKENCPFVN